MLTDLAASPSSTSPLPRRVLLAAVAAIAVLLSAGVTVRLVADPASVTRPIADAAATAGVAEEATTTTAATNPAAAAAAPANGPGYRLVGRDGGVFSYGWFGDAGS